VCTRCVAGGMSRLCVKCEACGHLACEKCLAGGDDAGAKCCVGGEGHLEAGETGVRKPGCSRRGYFGGTECTIGSSWGMETTLFPTT
jgi:hypothetical protein